MIVGPYGLGSLSAAYPGLHCVTISNVHAIEPFAELGIVLLLFRSVWACPSAGFGACGGLYSASVPSWSSPQPSWSLPDGGDYFSRGGIGPGTGALLNGNRTPAGWDALTSGTLGPRDAPFRGCGACPNRLRTGRHGPARGGRGVAPLSRPWSSAAWWPSRCCLPDDCSCPWLLLRLPGPKAQKCFSRPACWS